MSAPLAGITAYELEACEPTHRCSGCGLELWTVGAAVACPDCGEEAPLIDYCPCCDRPDCTVPSHQDAA